MPAGGPGRGLGLKKFPNTPGYTGAGNLQKECCTSSERRIFDRGVARKYLAFNSKALFGIVLGANISQADKSMIYSLLEKRKDKGLSDMKVYQARCADSEYKLKIWRV
jgi:hypothetical protein